MVLNIIFNCSSNSNRDSESILKIKLELKKMSLKEIENIAVIGAGTMGHSIAQVYATAGIEVNLVDVNTDILDYAIDLIRSNLNTLAEFDRVKSDEIPNIINRIHLSTNLS